jgi:hypothetical protein
MQQRMQADQPEAAVGQDAMGTGGGNIGVGQAPVPGEQGFPTGVVLSPSKVNHSKVAVRVSHLN